MKLFKDRRQAGIKLAQILKKYSGENPIVLALPRGGVPVGFEIAKVLKVPLEVIVSRKLGSPGNKELGIGAISEGSRILDQNMLLSAGVTENDLEKIIKEEESEIIRRIKLYRDNKPLPNLNDKTVILVDDGLATGVTARAAIDSVKKLNPKKIIIASPVCSGDVAKEISLLVDDIVCLAMPLNIYAIGLWYQNFEQTSDEEVIELLKQARGLTKP